MVPFEGTLPPRFRHVRPPSGQGRPSLVGLTASGSSVISELSASRSVAISPAAIVGSCSATRRVGGDRLEDIDAGACSDMSSQVTDWLPTIVRDGANVRPESWLPRARMSGKAHVCRSKR